MEMLTKRVLAAGDDVVDFKLRKQCLEDSEVLAFQRCLQHGRTLTNRNDGW